MSENPVGIFDSGIGGLTVANAVSELLPDEQIVYFGDTAHLPYGDKSSKAIRDYSREIMRFLEEKGCKLIVIACNSASASIGNTYSKWISHNIPVVNVIDPVIEHLALGKHKTIGLIGTKRTVKSGVFPKQLSIASPQKVMKSLATPLLAPMIEEGFYNNNISKTIINAYLDNTRLKGVQALVLACTHYPLIEKEIEELAGQQTEVINSASIVAEKVCKVLQVNKLQAGKNANPQHSFFVSDYTPSFEQAAIRFFGKKVKLTEHNLWKKQKG